MPKWSIYTVVTSRHCSGSSLYFCFELFPRSCFNFYFSVLCLFCMPLVAWGDEWLKELIRARAHTIGLQASNIGIYLINYYAHALLGFTARLIRRSERSFLRGFLLYIALPSYSLLILIPLTNMQLRYKTMSMMEYQGGINSSVQSDSRDIHLWNMWLTGRSWLDVWTGLWENHLRLVSIPWSYEYTAMFKLLPAFLL